MNNPYEKPELPRCSSCDEFMFEKGFGVSFVWECRNPSCEEAKEEYRYVQCSLCDTEYLYGEFCPDCTGQYL